MEMGSWLATDMTYNYLMDNWKTRTEDFKLISKKLGPESSVLDVGSGPVSVLHLFPACKRMVAVDPLNDKYVGKYKRLSHIEYVTSKAECLDFMDNAFDAVTCVNAIDHMDDYLKALEEMTRCLKPGGMLYLEYENTSPLSIFFAKLGYKKPLDDFHPILVQNKYVIEVLKKKNFKVLTIKSRPQFSFKKVAAIIKILLGKRTVSTYEQKISSANYGMGRMFFHYVIILLERALFFYWPKKYGYFTIVIAQKGNTVINKQEGKAICPVCGKNDSDFKFSGRDFYEKLVPGKFFLWKCLSCGTIFQYPMPANEKIGTFYPNDYYSYRVKRKKSFFDHLRENTIRVNFDGMNNFSFFWKVILIFVGKKFSDILPVYRKSGGTFLDVGCGDSVNLRILNEYGWDTYGIEIDPRAVAAARAENLNVTCSTLENYATEKKFDAIRLWHVLEHLPNPNESMRKLNSLLSEDGTIYMAIPNVRSLNAYIFGKYWIGYDVPRHLINYSLDSLKLLLKNNGFKMLEYKHSSTAGLVCSISNFINSLTKKKKFRLANNLFLVVFAYPYDLITDLLGLGDILFIKIQKNDQ